MKSRHLLNGVSVLSKQQDGTIVFAGNGAVLGLVQENKVILDQYKDAINRSMVKQMAQGYEDNQSTRRLIETG